MQHLGSQWTDFQKNYIWVFFENLSRIQVSLKSNKYNGYFTLRPTYIFNNISLSSSQNKKCFRPKRRENLNNKFYVQKPAFENHAVYEMMWKNDDERGRPQMTIRRMRIACWIPRATNTHPEYVILIAFPQQQWLHESASQMSRCTYIAWL